jgi:guanyl-specific ribonuclease Sa
LLSLVDRYYDPATDQFWSVDPKVAETGQPYAFTSDDPLNGTDPLGLCWLPGSVCNAIGDTLNAVKSFGEGLAGQRYPSTNGAAYDAGNVTWWAAAIGSALSDVGGGKGGSSQDDESVPEHASNTLKSVDDTGAAPKGYKGGGGFANDGRKGSEILPSNTASGEGIRYREWDVHPNEPGVDRGGERLVTGSNRSAYYTRNHYRSFRRIR